MFAMPFNDDHSMWQLSWPMAEDDAVQLSQSPAQLREAALQICQEWHEPVPAIIAASDFELHVSGYPAYDRPAPVAPELSTSNSSLFTLAGDAAHPMSPFKGQVCSLE